MSDFASTAALVILYRLVTVLSGLVIVYLGYRLFKTGFFEKSSELKAAWGDKHLILKQAAPGTLFALFGAGVIVIGIWRGVTFDLQTQDTGNGGETASKISDMASIGNGNLPAAFSGYSNVPDQIKDILVKIGNREALSDEEIDAIKSFRIQLNKISIHALKNPIKIEVLPGFEGLRDPPGLFQG